MLSMSTMNVCPSRIKKNVFQKNPGNQRCFGECNSKKEILPGSFNGQIDTISPEAIFVQIASQRFVYNLEYSIIF